MNRLKVQAYSVVFVGLVLAVLAKPGAYRCIARNGDTLSRAQCLLNLSTPTQSYAWDFTFSPSSSSTESLEAFQTFLQSTGYDEVTSQAGSLHGVDPNLVRAVILVESGFNGSAVSHQGAGGLMQLMPDTAKALGVRNRFNPSENIHGGTKYLRTLLDKFNENKILALAAYNAGPQAVKRYGGIPPYRETRNYVKKVMIAYEQMQSQGIA